MSNSKSPYMYSDGSKLQNLGDVSAYDTARGYSAEQSRINMAKARVKDRSRDHMTHNVVGMTFNNISGIEMVKVCIEIYEKIGIVRNIIDLLSDFTVDGIDIIHPNDSVQNFWSVWKKRIKLKDRSERITNTLLKAGTCAIRGRIGTITPKEERDMKRKGSAVKKVPIGYTIVNPKSYSIKGVKPDGTPIIEVYNQIRGENGILQLGKKEIINDSQYNYVCSYKKDDWELWAKPFHYAALDDLAFENKLQRMDEAAADGIINAVRIWKLGGETKDGAPIFPTSAATSKLATILTTETGGGVTDIIWDQFIDLKVEYPPVEKILGEEKYKHIRAKILEDFGIAEVLISGTGEGSYSNQYLSVRSLVEKVEYLRSIIIDWIETEIKKVAGEMNFKSLPKVSFRHVNLGDEAAKLNLVMQLYDRGVLSKTEMLNYVNQDWSVEKERIIKENNESESNPEIQKRGPFYQIENSSDNQENDVPGKPGGDGRPPNQPDDKTQQKKRTTKPQGGEFLSKFFVDAERIRNAISETIEPIYFKKCGAKNVKQLTKEQKEMLEEAKFRLMAGTDKFKQINEKYVKDYFDSPNAKESRVMAIYKNIVKNTDSSVNINELRNLQNIAWAMEKSGLEE